MTASLARLAVACVALCFLCLNPIGHLAASEPADLPLEARLIWGTDRDKPDDPNLKPVDQKLIKKFGSVFKWKNYFEVHRDTFIAKASSIAHVRMSKKCRLEVKQLQASWIEVKLYGEEKLVVKKHEPMKPGEVLVLAGDDKNDTAWFVVIMMPEKQK